jgi:hypothetical protein
MAYDEDLADRIRELVGSEANLTEKKMFGGLAFLIGGNMAVAASSQGGVLVRVDPAQSETLVATTTARPMEMGGRSMQGWLRLIRRTSGRSASLPSGSSSARPTPGRYPRSASTPSPHRRGRLPRLARAASPRPWPR